MRFDLKTEKFQASAIPARGGVGSDMMTSHRGSLVIAGSALDLVGLVTIGK